MRRITVCFVTAVLIAGGTLRADDPVSKAIDRGIDYLLAESKAEFQKLRGKYGSRKVPPQIDVGAFAMQLYGLVVAGVSVDDPLVRSGLKFLERLSFRGHRATYVTAVYVFLLDAAIAQLENDMMMLNPKLAGKRFKDDPRIGRQFRGRLKAAVDALSASQNGRGSWRYDYGAQDFDNSNVQFAVLALGIGAKRSIPIRRAVWQKTMDHFLRTQEKKGPKTSKRLELEETDEDRRNRVNVVSRDGSPVEEEEKESKEKRKSDRRGKTTSKQRRVIDVPDPIVGTEDVDVHSRGWAYLSASGGKEGHNRAKWAMTCAGVSSMLLVRANLPLKGSAKAELDKSIRDGYGWMMDHFNGGGNGYQMYSLEKVGDIGRVKLFAGNDWYSQLEKHILGRQRGNGSFDIDTHAKGEHPGLGSAYALLILNRATSLLSQSPATRIIVSGRTAPKGDLSDRSWVYVPVLDTTLHYPSLLRAIRLRPSPKLIKFLRNIIDNYADEWKGELIPGLARIRDEVTNRAARGIIDEYLTDITGFHYEDPEKYMTWFRRWSRVVKMAESGDSAYRKQLMTYYESTSRSVPLRKTVMWALTRVKARESIPLLLKDLAHEDPVVRLAAYTNLRAFYVEFPPPFDPNGDPATRSSQVRAIRTWQQEEEDKRRARGKRRS